MSKLALPSYCVVVADGARARFFSLDPASAPRNGHHAPLLEHREMINPSHSHSHGPADLPGQDWRRAAAGGPGRNDDASDNNWRREQDRRFAAEVIDSMTEMCQKWGASKAVVVADKRFLGLLRPKMERVAGIELVEHSRDLTGMEAPAIHAHLAAQAMLPATPGEVRQVQAR